MTATSRCRHDCIAASTTPSPPVPIRYSITRSPSLVYPSPSVTMTSGSFCSSNSTVPDADSDGIQLLSRGREVWVGIMSAGSVLARRLPSALMSLMTHLQSAMQTLSPSRTPASPNRGMSLVLRGPWQALHQRGHARHIPVGMPYGRSHQECHQ